MAGIIHLGLQTGDDDVTTAAHAYQFAGAFYGEGGIPPTWLAKLTMMTEIREIADRWAGKDTYAGTDDVLNSVASANN